MRQRPMRQRPRSLAPLLALAATLALAAPAAAQQPTGSLRGTIRNAAGQPVTSATVALEGTSYRTTSTQRGTFDFAALPAATYTLAVRTGDAPTLTLPATVAAGQVTTVAIQLPPPSTRLPQVTVTATRLPATGYIPDTENARLYAGKKTELVRLDALTANTAQDISRQVLGRIPGANISETEGSGFPSNGVGFRGLDPSLSIETNVRQNGIAIAADLYGYSESYYTPPLEAVDRIEIVRGASSLQFGPQFGGVVNYILRSGRPGTPLSLSAAQTAGSFGLTNTFASLGGTSGAWSYYGYGQFRQQSGWRPNSDVREGAAYATLRYQASPRMTLGLQYSLLRNRIQMPGGLSDAQYADGARQSFRARNWLASPWNVLGATLDYRLSPRARWVTTASFMRGARDLVWRSEDGGPGALDEIDPATGTYVPREVERDRYTNGTLETRLLVEHRLLGLPSTLATGVRLFDGRMTRAEGEGTTGSDYDLTLAEGEYEESLTYGTRNAAVFAENEIALSERLSLSPGVRVEYLRSTVRGYSDTTFAPQAKNRSIVLAGLGAEYRTAAGTELYGNISQSYRPITYAALTPVGGVSQIDPGLRDATGYNADLGWRGTAGRALTFDVSAFYLAYNDRVGLVSRTDANGEPYTVRTNVANSVHRGVESYLELAPLALAPAGGTSALGLRLFDAFSFVDARYTTGEFDGNRVEYAPRIINRMGLTAELGSLAATLQASYTGKSYADANNTVSSEDAVVGVIPAYTVLDLSGAYTIGRRVRLSFGVNNLADRRYIARRTDEYPGPGIIPGIGRSVYVGIRAGYP